MIVRSQEELKELLGSVAQIARERLRLDFPVFSFFPNLRQAWDVYKTLAPRQTTYNDPSIDASYAYDLVVIALLRPVLAATGGPQDYIERHKLNASLRVAGCLGILEVFGKETHPNSSHLCAANCASLAFNDKNFYAQCTEQLFNADRRAHDQLHRLVRAIRLEACNQMIREDESAISSDEMSDGG